MDSGHRWWYCLRHHTVEPDDGCPAKDRLGPYPTQEEAARALETVRRRFLTPRLLRDWLLLIHRMQGEQVDLEIVAG